MKAAANKEELFLKASNAVKAGRHEEAMEHIKSMVELGQRLTAAERGLLQEIYKQKVAPIRDKWRMMTTNIAMEIDMAKKTVMYKARESVGKELAAICDSILNLIDKYLMPKANDSSSRVFYLTLKGDFYRIKGEMLLDRHRTGILESDTLADHSNTIENSCKCYQDAHAIAMKELPVLDPLRLNLALTFSEFYYEIAQNVALAIKTAKEAFDSATSKLQALKEEEKYKHKEASEVLLKIRAKLAKWSPNMDPDEESNGDESGEDDE